MRRAPALVAITDAERHGVPATIEMCTTLCRARAGEVVVVLRDKRLSVRERLDLGYELRHLTRRAGQRLVVAARADLALLLDADGVHLGNDAVQPAQAVGLLRSAQSTWCSVAWHEDDVLPRAPVTALLISPVVSARKGRRALGLARFARVAERTRALGILPYALGGVTARECKALLAAGATGVAAIGAAYEDAPALLTALDLLGEQPLDA